MEMERCCDADTEDSQQWPDVHGLSPLHQAVHDVCHLKCRASDDDSTVFCVSCFHCLIKIQKLFPWQLGFWWWQWVLWLSVVKHASATSVGRVLIGWQWIHLRPITSLPQCWWLGRKDSCFTNPMVCFFGSWLNVKQLWNRKTEDCNSSGRRNNSRRFLHLQSVW